MAYIDNSIQGKDSNINEETSTDIKSHFRNKDEKTSNSEDIGEQKSNSVNIGKKKKKINDDEKKEIEIVNGNISNLHISPVYEHLPSEKPETTRNKPKNVVIPEEYKNFKKK